MKRRKINNLSDLRLEKERIRMQLEAKEEQLESSWVYLKHNYKGMIWEQLNPFKNSGLLNAALGLLQPGLLPVITEVVKGTIKGSPINGKVIGSTVKYAIANFGIKWLRKWLDDRNELEQEEELEEEIGKEESTQ
ncbi:MAG: hypothetical protein V4651_13800 [Bacteroidota bacterium]